MHIKRLPVELKQIAHLRRLIEKAADAQEQEHNSPNAPDSTPKIEAVERYAASLNCQCIWPGLYPVIIKDGEQYES